MRKIMNSSKILMVFTFLFLCIFKSISTCDFGYIEYFSDNIGDDIQSIAARQFLPESSISVNREFLSVFDNNRPVFTIMNGWFLFNKNHWDPYLPPVPPASWPPSSKIVPLLISMHISLIAYQDFFSEEGITYLKHYAPVGARDLHTLSLLTRYDIPCYFSGCLTLSLKNDMSERDNVIYTVDVETRLVQFIKEHANCEVINLTHKIPSEMRFDQKGRYEMAQHLLNNYKRARCVITSRLHVAMPCLAFGTPVLLITNQNDPRFSGLLRLVHHCTRNQYLNNSEIFNVNNPPENSDDYLEFRKNLTERVNNWVIESRKF